MHGSARQLHDLLGDRMPVIGKVEDLRGVTHSVESFGTRGLAGTTVCNLRFWTERLGTPSIFLLRCYPRTAVSDNPTDCIACLVGAPAYDEACNDGSPPTSETA
jgi:hypothetical protein